MQAQIRQVEERLGAAQRIVSGENTLRILEKEVKDMGNEGKGTRNRRQTKDRKVGGNSPSPSGSSVSESARTEPHEEERVNQTAATSTRRRTQVEDGEGRIMAPHDVDGDATTPR